MPNNYNINANGPNIACCVCHDSDVAQMLWDENFKVIKHGDRMVVGEYFYTDCGQISEKSLSEYVFKVPSYRAARKLSRDYYTAFNYPAKEAYDDLNEYYGDLLNELIADSGFEQAQDITSRYGISIDYKDDIRTIKTRGYSQGDYALVYVNFTALEKLWGKAPCEDNLRKEIDKLFWDCPVYAYAEINGEEYHYHEWPGLKSEYEWDRQGFIEWLAEESGIDIAEIDSVMPQEPEYN